MRSTTASLSLAALLLAGVAGCHSGPEIMAPTMNHSPLDAAAVRVFDDTQTQPKRYELLGVVESTGTLKYGDDFVIDPIIEGLKTQAAKMGANAILLKMPYQPGVTYVQGGGYYKDAFVHFTARMKPLPRAAVAQAIYIPAE